MLRVSRSPALRRAATAHATTTTRRTLLQQRRLLHEDSSRGSDYPNLTLSTPHLADPRFGMDLTRAPGYEVAADEDPPLIPSQKVVDFAVRHARLSASQVVHADGYIWVGNVLYPSGIAPDPDIAFSWEIVHDDRGLEEQEEEVVDDEVGDEGGEGEEVQVRGVVGDDDDVAAVKAAAPDTASKTASISTAYEDDRGNDDGALAAAPDSVERPVGSGDASKKLFSSQARRLKKERLRPVTRRAKRLAKKRVTRDHREHDNGGEEETD